MSKITDLNRLYEMARILREAPGNEHLANADLHDIAKIMLTEIVKKGNSMNLPPEDERPFEDRAISAIHRIKLRVANLESGLKEMEARIEALEAKKKETNT